MAVLGFHIVVTLIVLAIISKIGTRFSVIALYITRGLHRYMAPSNNELRALLPPIKDKNPRQRRKKREEEETTGFNVPKQSEFQLKRASVDELELQQFPLYSSVHWLSLFVPLCVLVYVISETFLYFYPNNPDLNISVIWLIIAVAFVLQVLTKLTAWLIVNDDERSLLLSLGFLFFLASCIFTMWSDRIFDVEMLKAYDQFGENVHRLMLEMGTPEDQAMAPKNPLLLYISLSVMFSVLSTMLVFPNFRYATTYTRALEMASPVMKLLLHLSFLMPLLCLVLFLKPVKAQLVFGKRKLFSEDGLDIFRIYLVIFSLALKMLLRRPHLQAHLDLPHEKVQKLQKETGYVRNTHLQALIFRYYSYFSAVVLQYFSPILLSFFFALLLKTTSGMSWLAVPPTTLISTPASPASAIRTVFDATVCKAFWTYALTITTFLNFSLSLMGVMYHSYFAN